MYLCVYIYIFTYIHIYIYIYICREDQALKAGEPLAAFQAVNKSLELKSQKTHRYHHLHESRTKRRNTKERCHISQKPWRMPRATACVHIYIVYILSYSIYIYILYYMDTSANICEFTAAIHFRILEESWVSLGRMKES